MKPNNPQDSLSYKDAGVDIDAGEALVQQIKPIAKRTLRPEVLGGLGGFGALFELSKKYQNPVLVSTTDGVGTKLKLAFALKKHDTIGIDLVAMCVNDLIVQGAEPLFFLDYFATSQLNVDVAAEVIAGIGKGCEQAGAALVGGETAEMPSMYSGGDYDLAGFAVGVVEKANIIDGSKVKPGAVLIGLASSGPHSNGYSLIRKIVELNNGDLKIPMGERTLGEVLLEPTKIYVKSILALIKKVAVHGIAHITGGGILENLPRVLPANCMALINKNSWQWPEIFHWLQAQGNVAEEEMYRTFNCGIGMIICVDKNDVTRSLEILTAAGETAWPIGIIKANDTNKPYVKIDSLADLV